MRIIFVRHGQTVFNLESRYQGHMDAKLTALGMRQAEVVGEKLSSEEISAIYSSDLSRAMETAKAISARYNLDVIADPDLRECSFGEWQGLTVTEIRERYPGLFANYLRDSITFRAPGGERLEELQERVVRAVERIAADHPRQNVAIVTHGGPIKAFICHALGTSLETFRKIHLDNAGITILALEQSGRWFLEALNDHCHLQGIRS